LHRAEVDADRAAAQRAADVGGAGDGWSGGRDELGGALRRQRAQLLLDLRARGIGERQLEGSLQRGNGWIAFVRALAHSRLQANDLGYRGAKRERGRRRAAASERRVELFPGRWKMCA